MLSHADLAILATNDETITVIGHPPPPPPVTNPGGGSNEGGGDGDSGTAQVIINEDGIRAQIMASTSGQAIGGADTPTKAYYQGQLIDGTQHLVFDPGTGIIKGTTTFTITGPKGIGITISNSIEGPEASIAKQFSDANTAVQNTVQAFVTTIEHVIGQGVTAVKEIATDVGHGLTSAMSGQANSQQLMMVPDNANQTQGYVTNTDMITQQIRPDIVVTQNNFG